MIKCKLRVTINKEFAMDNSKYIDYVNSHVDEITAYVDKCFEQSKDFIKIKLIRLIRDYLSPIPIHYVIKNDYDPYDSSGILIEQGYVSLDQTVKEFLQNEYSGNKEATYTSGMGWDYNTYGHELHYETINIAADIMYSAICRYIEDQFHVSLSDEEIEDIHDSCEDFDRIYDNCIANEFFFGTPAVEFVGIENMLLKDIVKKK